MTAVFSAEYAQELLQRAIGGATFHETCDMDLVPFFECERKMHEDHDGYGSDERHWVAWYRETVAAGILAEWISAGTTTAYGTPRDGTWPSCAASMNRIVGRFVAAIGALGALCQLPETWTAEHRAEARRIGGEHE